MDYGIIITVILITILIYFYLESTSDKQVNGLEVIDIEHQDQIEKLDNKFEKLFVYFKTIPESNEYTFTHIKMGKRNKPEYKNYSHTNNVLYFSLNKILRHFNLNCDFDKKEIMQLNYIPDNFDLTSFNNHRHFNQFEDIPDEDINKLQDFLPNNIAKVLNEIDNQLEDLEIDPEESNFKRSKISFKKNKITLKTQDNYFLNIKYSTFPKEDYEIAAINDNIIESVVKLRQIPLLEGPKGKKGKDKKFLYYIKFPNDYYLCVNKNLILYASKDKNKIFYFDIVVVPEDLVPKDLNEN